jgi:hypothetical protein
MSSRGKVPNEILLLRVREIHDHVFEHIREPWFNGKRLFRVSNAHPVGRASEYARACSTKLATSIAVEKVDIEGTYT